MGFFLILTLGWYLIHEKNLSETKKNFPESILTNVLLMLKNCFKKSRKNWKSRIPLTLALAECLIEEHIPLKRFCGKLYSWIDCIFFRYYSKIHFYHFNWNQNLKKTIPSQKFYFWKPISNFSNKRFFFIYDSKKYEINSRDPDKLKFFYKKSSN